MKLEDVKVGQRVIASAMSTRYGEIGRVSELISGSFDSEGWIYVDYPNCKSFPTLASWVELADAEIPLNGQSGKFPADAAERKTYPVGTGVADYFPDALIAVSHVSYVGNKQHGLTGETVRWDRSKSTDEADALMRHFLERGTIDTDGQRHSAKLCWRALALLQKEIEAEREKK